VLFCGWLVNTRGLELLSTILEKTNDKIEFILVGSGDQNLIDSLTNKNRIKYIGHLTRDHILNLMTKVDINIAFYNPNILINRFALPQKIYDSLMVGCPLLVNSEVKFSGKLLKSKSCFAIKYFDVFKICSKLNELVKNKKPLLKMSKTMQTYYKQHINQQKIELIGKNLYRQIVKY
jgi:glycosyltransferase involved in cell wall biosynthesis